MEIDNLKFELKPDNSINTYLLYCNNERVIELPESVAIILDGNGRYAEKMNISRALGHKAGCEALEVILEETVKLGIRYLTVYAFSTENWKRSNEEIYALFDLFFLYLNKIEEKATKNNVKVSFIGDIYKFKKELYLKCEHLMNVTSHNTRCTFTIAFNYGGRDEIVRTIKRMNANSFDFNNLTEADITHNLDTKDIKDPDLLIRTSGELRVSNFLLWQIAYSEIYITNVLWPEFSENEYYKSLYSYSLRKRRYGGR